MKPGRELDELVAKVMGLSIYPYDEIQGKHDWLNSPNNYPHLTSGEGDHLILWLKPNFDGWLWTPSSSTELAMWVFEWLEKRYPSGEVLIGKSSEGLPSVIFLTQIDKGIWTIYNTVSADTIPAAICLAVLGTLTKA